ncbi:MAG TPA: SAM-dependent methyltransferase [Streptosporangiaceae bacterium]|nr:SAM-dependent methyltransferase [Streptosporangiaceae bacterium]
MRDEPMPRSGGCGEGDPDPDAPAQTRAAATGGHNATARYRREVGAITARWPFTARLVRDANSFHRRASAWAVTAGGCSGVVYAAAGYPPEGEPPLHAPAARENPGALFGYCDPSGKVTAVLAGTLAMADPEHVSTWTARWADPEAVLGAPAAREMTRRGPVMVQAVLVPQRLSSRECARIIAAYARMLPPGSSLALSMGTADSRWPDLQDYLAAVSAVAGAQVRAHSPRQAARWLARAGFALHPFGVRDGASWEGPAPVRGDSGQPWVMSVIGMLPG